MKLPWKWIVLACVVVLALSLIAYGGTGYQMAREWILGDQATIQKDLENEVTKLDTERDGYLKELAGLKQERNKLNNDYTILKGKYNDLEVAFHNIIVPTDPNSLADAFRKRGYSPTIRRVLPSK